MAVLGMGKRCNLHGVLGKEIAAVVGGFCEEEKMGTDLTGALQEPFLLESSSGVIYICIYIYKVMK